MKLTAVARVWSLGLPLLVCAAASHAAELIQQLVAQGDGELDSSAIARLIASRRA